MSDEKVAVVTAGGSGMGAASARRLAADGFKVAILSSSGKGEALADELGGIGVTVSFIRATQRCAYVWFASFADGLLSVSSEVNETGAPPASGVPWQVVQRVCSTA